LTSGNGGKIYWQPDSFGVDQEAFVTLVKIDPIGAKQGLLLKAQGPGSWATPHHILGGKTTPAAATHLANVFNRLEPGRTGGVGGGGVDAEFSRVLDLSVIIFSAYLHNLYVRTPSRSLIPTLLSISRRNAWRGFISRARAK
jgi:hypothetical protein